MSVGRSTFIMSGDRYFESGIRINVNRVSETFELNTHSHEFIEITYTSEGAGVHYIDDEAVPVEHGTLFLFQLVVVMCLDPERVRKTIHLSFITVCFRRNI